MMSCQCWLNKVSTAEDMQTISFPRFIHADHEGNPERTEPALKRLRNGHEVYAQYLKLQFAFTCASYRPNFAVRCIVVEYDPSGFHSQRAMQNCVSLHVNGLNGWFVGVDGNGHRGSDGQADNTLHNELTGRGDLPAMMDMINTHSNHHIKVLRDFLVTSSVNNCSVEAQHGHGQTGYVSQVLGIANEVLEATPVISAVPHLFEHTRVNTEYRTVKIPISKKMRWPMVEDARFPSAPEYKDYCVIFTCYDDPHTPTGEILGHVQCVSEFAFKDP